MYIKVNGFDGNDKIIDASVFYSIYNKQDVNPIYKDYPYSIRGITHDGKERYIAFFTSKGNAREALSNIYSAMEEHYNATYVYER